MNFHRISAVVIATLLMTFAQSPALYADVVRLKTVADTNVSSYAGEQGLNYGASSRLRLKGIQMFALMKFDTSPIAGWKVASARLHFRYAGNDRRLRTIGVSTISVNWQEGDGSGESRSDQTCFAHPSGKFSTWAGPQTDLTDVTFTAGGTIAAYSDIKPEADGWMSVDVSPRLIQALLCGSSYGLAITDEKGQTAANNDIYSREQNGSAPYLEVSGAPSQTINPAIATVTAEPDLAHATFTEGSVKITFSATNAFTIRARWRLEDSDAWQAVTQNYLPPPGSCNKAAFHLPIVPGNRRIQLEITPVAINGATGTPRSINARTSATVLAVPQLLAPPAVATTAASKLTATTGASLTAYNETVKVDPTTGRPLFEPQMAGLLHNGAVELNALPGETIGFQLALIGPAWKGSIKLSMPAELISSTGERIHIFSEIFQAWYVKSGNWIPEVCIPIPAGKFQLPRQDNPVPNQICHSLYIDLYVPAEAKPGTYRVHLALQGGAISTVPLVLTVGKHAIPPVPGFDVSLNAYGTVGQDFGLDDRTQEYRNLEREYHRLSFLHRSVLAPLGYSHSGSISSNYAPTLSGSGPDLHVESWAAWDAQFRPYLTGSAFKGLPVPAAPISHIYLPFHEAWPIDIRKHYNYEQQERAYPALISEHALKADSIEQSVDANLRQGFESVAKDYARHFQENGWTQTALQFYQNDKYYYKDPKQGGRGTSWWLLDEPNHRDDWLALAFFNRIFRNGVGHNPAAKFVIREDISRPQWQRDYLEGLVDLMCVSNELFTHQPCLQKFQEQGIKLWNYGSVAAAARSATEIEAWAIYAWLYGADGIVPWQTIGTDRNYTETEDTALLLPGKRFGITGPIASVRLKALRRAEQDVEYLRLLQKTTGWTRAQVGHAIARLLPEPPASNKKDDDDAGSYLFRSASGEQMEALRASIRTYLSAH